MFNKIFWIFRYLLYFPFFGSAGFPCYLGKPICLNGIKKIHIGSRVRIYPNARFEVHGDGGSIVINDNTGIAQNVHITAGANLEIGKNTTILANVFITDIDHGYEQIDIPILSQPNIIRKTSIGENCFIGIGASIQAGTILGRQCIVGTNAVVRGSFPDYCVIAGSPAKIIKRFDVGTKSWVKFI